MISKVKKLIGRKPLLTCALFSAILAWAIILAPRALVRTTAESSLRAMVQALLDRDEARARSHCTPAGWAALSRLYEDDPWGAVGGHDLYMGFAMCKTREVNDASVSFLIRTATQAVPGSTTLESETSLFVMQRQGYQWLLADVRPDPNKP